MNNGYFSIITIARLTTQEKYYLIPREKRLRGDFELSESAKQSYNPKPLRLTQGERQMAIKNHNYQMAKFVISAPDIRHLPKDTELRWLLLAALMRGNPVR